jgi:peptidoglycan-N-acetylglucosamine deacetylase
MALAPEAGAGVAAALGLAAGAYLWAGRWPTSQLFGHTLVAGNDPQEVALTFDDGPHERWTQEILEFLANYRVRATFFMVGRSARALPWLVRQVRAAGHLVGSHTETHPNLMWAAPSRVRAEVESARTSLEDTLGEPVRFFRPPYGGRRPDVLRLLHELDLQPVLWNVSSYDWHARKSPDSIVSTVQRAVAKNQRAGRASNILLHDGSPEGASAVRARTTTAVPALAHVLKREGFRFVTVDQWTAEKGR